MKVNFSLETEIEIEIGMQHVQVPVRVNGKGPFSFTLDTGASVTSISKRIAEQLGIETRDGSRIEATGVGGSIPVKYADVEIGIGALEFEKDEVYVMDFDAIFRGIGNHEGVFGFTTLNQCTLSLNYKTKSLKIRKGSSDSDLHWTPFKYIKDSHLVGVPVHINGKGPFDFVLDTGAGNTCITPTLATQIELDATPVQGIARGLGGDVQLELAAVDTLSIGETTISNSQMVVIDLSKVSPKGDLIENGIIGYDFLSRFETVIDYPKKRFSFIDD
jgi:predicted aspartyl protease